MTHDDEPVSMWIGDLKAGDAEAAQKLWDKYHAQLLAFARRKLGPIPTRTFDEEDIALSAFHSFCVRAGKDGFPKLDNRNELWALLATITARRVLMRKRHELRACRGGGEVGGESVFLVPGGAETDPRAGIGNVAGDTPTPEFAAEMAEEVERLLNQLDDPALRLIAVARMEGWSNAEIAERLGLTDRTVRRKLKVIALKWEQEV